jgi:hypothetical protein
MSDCGRSGRTYLNNSIISLVYAISRLSVILAQNVANFGRCFCFISLLKIHHLVHENYEINFSNDMYLYHATVCCSTNLSSPPFLLWFVATIPLSSSYRNRSIWPRGQGWFRFFNLYVHFNVYSTLLIINIAVKDPVGPFHRTVVAKLFHFTEHHGTFFRTP